MAEGYTARVADLEVTTWTPNLPRSTYSDLSGNNVYRCGDYVICKAHFKITTSNNLNDYIDASSYPDFGRNITFALGQWYDNSNDSGGIFGAGDNNNTWFTYNGSNINLSSRVNHFIYVNIIYCLT